jgi:arginase
MIGQAPRRPVRIIGCPMDLGAGRRGVDMGPSALRIAGVGRALEELGYVVHDWGDITVRTAESHQPQDMHLKFLAEISAACSTLCSVVGAALARDEFPLVLGGDHSMAIGTLAGLASVVQPAGGSVGVLWVDAHADINTPDTSPSGNIHGMPLAVALGQGAPELTGIGGPEPKLAPERLVYVGLRSVDDGEREMVRRLGIRAYTMTDIDRLGIAGIAREALDYLLPRCTHLHLSFDLDSLDPQLAPGVGTPVPGGLTYREAHYLMEAIAETGRLASLEVAEVNPVLDNRNTSSELAAGLVGSALGLRVL